MKDKGQITGLLVSNNLLFFALSMLLSQQNIILHEKFHSCPILLIFILKIQPEFYEQYRNSSWNSNQASHTATTGHEIHICMKRDGNVRITITMELDSNSSGLQWLLVNHPILTV